MESFIQWFASHLSWLPPQLAVFVISLFPILENRAGIILAFMLKLPLWEAILFSAIGNILPIPFILLFIRKIFDWLRPTKFFGGIVKKLEDRAMKKSDGVRKAEFMGLLLFVGIPLPGTGGWTGSLIASLLEVDIKKASIAILCGIALAATIVSLLTYGVIGHIA
ncbi:MAG: small multi-drug export protein [Lachnospiraceae bacterium]|nr:small multi-drug export protein [Lachnospiraceae bacterium]